MKKTAMAISHGNASARRKRCRLARWSPPRSRAVAPGVSLAAIEPRRLYEENDDRHRVDEKAARIGQQIFATGVEYAEHQRREQCSLQAAKAPDRHHDQEQHQIEHRKAR